MTENNRLHKDTLRQITFAPGYRDISIEIQDHHGINREFNLSAKDALWLHRRLDRMCDLAGDQPLDVIE